MNKIIETFLKKDFFRQRDYLTITKKELIRFLLAKKRITVKNKIYKLRVKHTK